MKRIALSLCLALLVSACQTNQGMRTYNANEPREPIKPGQTRITFKNEDKDHWIATRDNSINATVLTCRPLGCPANTVVIHKSIASTRNPDPTAIMKLANHLIDSEVEKGATMTARPQIGKFKNYPFIAFGWSYTKDDKTVYAYRKLVFAGGIATSFQSGSLDKAFAQKVVDQFFAMIEIEDGGSVK
jgi:hypothetical protein